MKPENDRKKLTSAGLEQRPAGDFDIATNRPLAPATPGTHSPEAIAAYPDVYPEWPRYHRVTLRERTAFDAGVAATHAQQYATTREALIAVLLDEDNYERLHYAGTFEDVFQPHKAADALLATTGPLLDAAEVARTAKIQAVDDIRDVGHWDCNDPQCRVHSIRKGAKP